MSILLDLMSAAMIGGMVLVMFINLNLFSSQARYASDSELQLQQNAKTLAEIINHDVRKIGFNYSANPIKTAQSNKFVFYADIDSNGVSDEVGYYLSDTSLVSHTSNPKDRVLIRQVNADSSLQGPSLGITDLKFSYLNNLGKTTAVIDSIKYIKTEIWVESPEKVDDRYLFTYWELTINPRNL